MRGPSRQQKPWKPQVFKPDRAFETFLNREIYLKGKDMTRKGFYKAVTKKLEIPLSQSGPEYDEAAWVVRRKGHSFMLWLELNGPGRMDRSKLLIADLEEQTLSVLGKCDMCEVDGLHPGDRTKVLNLPALLQVVANVFGWNQQLEWCYEPALSGDMQDQQRHWVCIIDAQSEPWYYSDSVLDHGQRRLSEKAFDARRERVQRFHRLYAMHWLPPDLVQRYGTDRYRDSTPGTLVRRWLEMVAWCIDIERRKRRKDHFHRNPALSLPYGIFQPEDNYTQPVVVLKAPRDYAQEYEENWLVEALKTGLSTDELEDTQEWGIRMRTERKPDLIDSTLALYGIPLNGRPGYSLPAPWVPPLMTDGLTPLLAGEELVVRRESAAPEPPREEALLSALRSVSAFRQLRALEVLRTTGDDTLLAGVMDTMMWSRDREVRAKARSIFRKQAPGEVQILLRKYWRPSFRTHKSPPLGALVDSLMEGNFVPYTMVIHDRGIELAEQLLNHERPHPNHWSQYLENALKRLGRCAYLPLEGIRQSILESGEPHVIGAPEIMSFHPYEYTAEDIEGLQALATGEAS